MSGKVTNAKEHIGWHKHDTKPGLEILEGSRMVRTPLGPPNVKKNKKGTRKPNVKKGFLVLFLFFLKLGGPRGSGPSWTPPRSPALYKTTFQCMSMPETSWTFFKTLRRHKSCITGADWARYVDRLTTSWCWWCVPKWHPGECKEGTSGWQLLSFFLGRPPVRSRLARVRAPLCDDVRSGPATGSSGLLSASLKSH